ncbi:hypothetical protein MTO96_051386 [Rhipicephalus appendiculatus]
MKGKSCHSGNLSKDRAIVLLYCKKWQQYDKMMKKQMIGKAKNPTCLQNIVRLPCVYKNNTKVWITLELFEGFLHYLYGRLRCKGHSGVLFLDNCATHRKDTSLLRNLRVVFPLGKHDRPPAASRH